MIYSILSIDTSLSIKEALLDTSAKVNIMSLKIVEALNLLIESPEALYSISYNRSLRRFLGVIRDLDVKVLDVKVIVYIFIAKVVDLKYSIILGNPYLVSIRAEITRDDKGNYFIKL